MRIDMIGRWLTHLLFPPVCRGCGERWDIFRNEDPGALCDKCFAEWEEAVKGLSFTMPSLLAGSGSRAHLARVAYQPGKKQLAERLVLRIKDKRDRELFRFFAEDMRLPLWQLIEQHGGKVPGTMEELTALPGIGRKTANLILGDIYGEPSYVCDTHCIRITGRLGITDGSKDPLQVEKQLRVALPPEESGDFCHRMVLFGRDTCTARSPRCGSCPLRELCDGRQ
jgi:hypothetical protein